MNKRVTKLFIVLAISIMLLGCSRLKPKEIETIAETTTPIETTTAEEFQECTEEEYEKARRDVDIIIQALNNQDSEQLKSVLTDVTLQGTPHLDEEIQSVFDMLDGEVVEVKEHSVRCNVIKLCDENRSVIYML